MIVPIVLLTGAGIFAATRLDTSAGTDTLVSKGSPEFKATQDFHQDFGDEPVIVLVKEDLRKLVLTKDLEPLFELEECFAGGTQLAAALPASRRRSRSRRSATRSPSCTRATPCSARRPSSILSVAGIQQALQGQIGGGASRRGPPASGCTGRREARAPRPRSSSRPPTPPPSRSSASSSASLTQVAIQYGITSIPRLDDPNFVSRVVFDESKPAGTPKERFGYLFPNRDAAQIIVRLRPDLTDAERHEAIGLFKQAVRTRASSSATAATSSPARRSWWTPGRGSSATRRCCCSRRGPGDGADPAAHPAAAAAPAAAGVAVSAGALTLGLVALFGGSLTVGAIAMLPVLVGLAVDYAIQFQARFNEARAEGRRPDAPWRRPPPVAAPSSARRCLATIAGFAVFALSPSPLVRSFGLLLVIGIAMAFLVALTGGLAALGLSAWRGSAPAAGAPVARREAGVNDRLAEDRRCAAIAMALASPRRCWPPGCCWRSAAGWRAPAPASRPTSATSRRRT